MMLQPRKFKFKNKQKRRGAPTFRETTLCYGDSGIRPISPLRISAKKIFRLKVFLKRAVKKPEITKRRVWFNLFPHLPLTKKPKGVRMGKGAGKLNSWLLELPGGIIFLEFRNLRRGRLEYFFKKLHHKLKAPLKLVHKDSRVLTSAGVSGVISLCRKFNQ